MSATNINKSLFLAASRETVWSYLTEKDKLALWFHPADTDLAEGQPFALLGKIGEPGSRVCWGTVLSMQAPCTLRYTFTIAPLGGVMTTVTWTLEEAAGGTRVTLLHEGIEAAAGDAALHLLMALEAGWDKHGASLRAAVA